MNKQRSVVFFAELDNPNLKNQDNGSAVSCEENLYERERKDGWEEEHASEDCLQLPSDVDKRNILFQQRAFSSFTEPQQTVSWAFPQITKVVLSF